MSWLKKMLENLSMKLVNDGDWKLMKDEILQKADCLIEFAANMRSGYRYDD